MAGRVVRGEARQIVIASLGDANLWWKEFLFSESTRLFFLFCCAELDLGFGSLIWSLELFSVQKWQHYLHGVVRGTNNDNIQITISSRAGEGIKGGFQRQCSLLAGVL